MVEIGPLRSQLTSLKDDPFVAADYVDFRLGLLEAQSQVLAALPPLEVLPGTTLPLTPAAIPLDADLLVSLAGWFLSAAGGGGEQAEEFEALVAWGRGDPARLVELAGLAAMGREEPRIDEIAANLQVGRHALDFVGRAMFSPFVQAARLRLLAAGMSPAPPGGKQALCPVCANPPALGIITADQGRRILGCPLCGHRWTWTRLACPDCGNREQEELSSLSLDREDPRWIEACDSCRGYIKTLDGRRLGEVPSLLVEEVRTLHLDILAVKEGLVARSPYTALV